MDLRLDLVVKRGCPVAAPTCAGFRMLRPPSLPSCTRVTRAGRRQRRSVFPRRRDGRHRTPSSPSVRTWGIARGRWFGSDSYL